MKRQYLIIPITIVLVGLGNLLNSSINKNKKQKSQKQIVKPPKHAVKLNESQYKKLEKVFIRSYQAFPNNNSIAKCHHTFLLKDASNYLGYIRSKGLGFYRNFKSKTYFISKSKGWQTPSFGYFPIYTKKSDAFGYNTKPLKKLSQSRTRNHRGYHAYGYPDRFEKLITAIRGFGPQKPSKMRYFRYFLDTLNTNHQYRYYYFSAIDTVSYKNNPVKGMGQILIDKSSGEIHKIKSDCIEYNSITHGIVRNFGKLPPYNTSFDIKYKKFDFGLFYKKINMQINFVRSTGPGRSPRRREPTKHQLTQTATLYIDAMFQQPSDLLIREVPWEKVNYNTKVWADDNIIKPENIKKIKEDLSNKKSLTKQFQENDGNVFNEPGYTYSKQETKQYKRLKFFYDSISHNIGN